MAKPFLLIICAVSFLISVSAAARVQDAPPATPVAPTNSKEDIALPLPGFSMKAVLEVFFKAVDKGQLQVFGIIIDKTKIKPTRVEFVYDVGGFEPRVEVYSELIEPIPIPKVEQLCIHGVNAIMDTNGNIIESVAFCGN